MKWVLATSNQGKRQEFEHLFQGVFKDLNLICQNQFTDLQAIENGNSFIENAIIKARFAARHANLPALADDSGLCVDALGGLPSLYSARWHEKCGDFGYALPNDFPKNLPKDDKNIAALLWHMKGKTNRACAFVCALAWVRHADDPDPIVAVGRWQGALLDAPSGVGGFGYDPVFFDDHVGKTAAMMGDEKHKVSHRAQALTGLLKSLNFARIGGFLNTKRNSNERQAK